MQLRTWNASFACTALGLALTLALGLGLSACDGASSAPSPFTEQAQEELEAAQAEQEAQDADIIRQGIESELDMLKNPTQETLAPFLSIYDEQTLALLEDYAINYVELVRHLMAKMSYSIDEVVPSGDSAQVTLTISNVDIAAALGGLEDTLNSEQGQAEFAALYEAQDQAALTQAALDYAFRCIDGYTETRSTTVQLTLSKNDGSWSVDEASRQAFVGALYAGVDFAAWSL